MSEDLKAIAARNVSYNAISTILISIMQFVSSLLLARVLMPKDYGIVGFAQIFTNFMMQFCDFGINSAIIQKKDVDDITYYTAFTLKVVLSVTIFSFLILAAPLAKQFMMQQNITAVIRLLSVNFLISIITFMPQVMLTRDLSYDKLFLPQVLSVAASSVVSIVMAYNGFAYWSIVSGSLISNLICAVLTYKNKPVSFRFAFDYEVAKRLMHFGGSLLLPGIIAFLIFNTDNFIIGSSLGAEQLGYYSVSFNWGSIICVLMSGIFHKVLFPTFSKLQQDIPIMKKAYLSSVRHIAFLATPLNILLLIEGREFLFHILGRETERWFPALLSFQILCAYGILRAVLEPIGNVIMGLGRPRLFLKATLVVALIEITLVYPAISFYGIAGAAIVVTVAYASQYLIYLPILKKELNITYYEFFDATKLVIFAVTVMALTLLGMRQFLFLSWFSFIFNSVVSIIVYIVVFGVADKMKLYKDYSYLLRTI